ncbi:MAG: copper chaperone PCu(A)C [Micavibrio sp.]
MRIPSFLIALAFLSFPAVAAETVTVSDAYSFAVPEGGKNAVAFMSVAYPVGDGDAIPDRILRVETPIAERAELHTMVIENDVMQMRRADSFPLPPTGQFALKPQGAHIMVMGLNRGLAVGDTYPMTVVFEKAGAVTTEVSVRAAGDVPESQPSTEPPEEKAVHEDVAPAHDHHH